MSRPQDHSATERIMSLKNSSRKQSANCELHFRFKMWRDVSSNLYLLALVLRRRQKFYHIHFLSHHKREEPFIQFSNARCSTKRVSAVRWGWGWGWGKLNKETPVPFKTANNEGLKRRSIKKNLHSKNRVLYITVPDLSFAFTKAYTTLNESYFLLTLNHILYQRRIAHNFRIFRQYQPCAQ
jgi:hypothetical protein